MTYLDGLNEKQKEAVLHSDGPLLVVAGAGAGKTKTIAHRIARMIADGLPPRAALAVTFTNKAAGEMRERVRSLLPEVARGRGEPFVSTFHALGVRLLREFHKEANLPRGFVIWDRDDSTRAVKAAAEKLGLSFTPRALLSSISRLKGECVTAAEYAECASNFRERAVASAWREYEKRLEDEGALDFDDILGKTLVLLKQSPHVLETLQKRWSHITIDEYQDTNLVQYEIARLLAGERRNICVVGDIDQNIYSWRGADIEHLLGFERAFPGTKVVTLEQNYRSTRTILSAANAVIEKNQRRLPKELFTENPVGEAIEVYQAHDEGDEAFFIAQRCASLIKNGTRASEIAILYRENFQSRAIEEALLHTGLPYRVLGVRFFERKEVKDVLAFLRAALNPRSKSDLARAAGAVPRGIGKVTLEKLLTSGEESLTGAAKVKVSALVTSLKAIQAACTTLPAAEAVRYAAEESGIVRALESAGEEGKERLENVRELANLATRFNDMTPPEGIEKLLEDAALQSDQDELDKTVPAISLMTVHAAKGLEFDAVFVTGLEQGLFPSQRESDSERDEEEERRLFYVALTRARKFAILTLARQRMRWGKREWTIPSEFIDDIDQRLLADTTPKRGLLDDYEDIIT